MLIFGKFSCEFSLGGAGSRVPPATWGVVIIKYPEAGSLVFLGLVEEGELSGGFFGPNILGWQFWGPNVISECFLGSTQISIDFLLASGAKCEAWVAVL